MASHLCLMIAAVLLPPLAVFLQYGCSLPLLINIVLCFLGYIPGIIHAVYLVASSKDGNSSGGASGGSSGAAA